MPAAFDKAKALMGEFQVPVVVEVILEKVTNISMGLEINAVNEFEQLGSGRTRHRVPAGPRKRVPRRRRTRDRIREPR
jgi:glyoxylate carboligase